MMVPGPQEVLWAQDGWCPFRAGPWLPTSGKGLPHSCAAASPSRAWAHSSPQLLLRGVSPQDGPPPWPGLDTPPAHPVLSVNFWVNSVSPPDLPFNPDKHESVNRASKGARGLLTHSAPSPATHQTHTA